LIEAELFGSVKGAFTGSVMSREGKFQAADGGTILLDEVGDMSLRVQTKVLRAIQEGEIERVGSDKTITVDVRVLAATNKNLEEEIAAGRFREDLYFRLNVVPIAAKPLREHPEDIAFLAGAFIKSYCAENGLPEKKLDDRVLGLLKRYSWPGNVRELKNQVERLIIMSPGTTVHVEDLSPDIRSGVLVKAAPGYVPAEDERHTDDSDHDGSNMLPSESEIAEGALTLQEARREFERRMIRRALERHGWNVTRAAGELGMERTALHKKMKSLGLEKGGV
jgi:two-component system nitrogen regulation response regulator NtrX